MQSELLILAHRGGMSRAPENTILSFEQALTDGADAFECDVCLTQDKEPVMIHVDVKKNSLKELTYDQILTYLKSAKKEDRLEKYKALLKFRNIPFEADLFTWHNEDL